MHNADKLSKSDAAISQPNMTIEDAVRICRESALEGWELVAFAQRLVSIRMSYSYFNSFDKPETAFEKGMGYCWQQAGAFNKILNRLGFDSRLVHSTRNRFPDVVREGVTVHIGVSGHVWCRVRIGSEEKDACPGSPDNKPGKLHFTTLGKVYNFSGPIVVLSYLGSAAVNRRRGKRFLSQKAKLECLHNAGKCACKKNGCQRFRKCEECIEYHYDKGGKPACER